MTDEKTEVSGDAIALLGEFGLTAQEAAVYLALSAEGGLNGYEVAKVTGISRSASYTALASLVEKGAAWLIEGDSVRYQAVSAKEFCGNRLHRLGQLSARLEALVPARREKAGGYVTIRGREKILDRLRNLVAEADERVYLSLSGTVLALLRDELAALLAAGKKAVIITDADAASSLAEDRAFRRAQFHALSVEEFQIRAIADSRYVLTGDLSGADGATCLFSDRENLVELFKTALRNEIRLSELEGGLSAGGTGSAQGGGGRGRR